MMRAVDHHFSSGSVVSPVTSARRAWRCLMGLLFLLVPIALGAVVVSCAGKVAEDRPVFLVVSGDTDGWLTPCGCTFNQSGGLLRRGTYLRQLGQKGQVIYADAGGAPTGSSAYHKMRFEAILAGEIKMNIVAHNLGGPEVALGVEYLRDLQKRYRIPMISANVVDAQGAPLAPPMIVAAAGHRKVAFVGVVSQQFSSTTKDLRIEDPATAIRRTLLESKNTYDLLVILAYLSENELRTLAEALPEADAIIGGPTGQSIVPRKVGPTVIAASTHQGKFMVEMSVPMHKGESWSGRIVEMTGLFADDPTQKQNVAEYLQSLERADFESTQTGLVTSLVTDPSVRIAGKDSCTRCHQEESRIWHTTPHSRAWQTLQKDHHQVDPACQRCHTTGYGLPGGFVSASRGTNVGVGCENCHGPSQAHVMDPKIKTMYRPADQCVRCHDAENSPNFHLSEYWRKIMHGKNAGIRPL